MGKIQISGKIIETKAVAFDKDGTLFQATPFWQEIDRLRKSKFSQVVGKKYEPLWEKAVGFVPPNQVDFKGLLAVASEEEEIIVVASLLYQIKKYPWHRCKELATTIFEESNEQLSIEQAFHPIQGVTECIISLQKEGIYTGILTSDNKVRTKKCIDLLNIPSFQFLFTPEDVENGKPYPEMITKACEQLAIKSNELVMIGDTVVDVKMAKDAGSIAVGIANHEHAIKELTPYADFIITDYNDIQVLTKKDSRQSLSTASIS
ncbi:haloacid dehalogenase [Bacillus pseudomycoides]|uniref:HAD family hydrolase n=1 Tax=Bacillus pseudomycoides TaxID=64104 RepID=A0AAJ3RDU0_9BACI|nr:HAD family hydrolase [Bacillus pseudomycoides]EEM03974.1 HAD-superfamily hydrolase, subfamily IA, variant 3 [Bacillus pseudomycoides]MBD5797316.1 haloacid dehalogenase [Bacillus pseudomycoides]MCR8856921.1 HAD family hydrolase [Bacillus pseudomycoides]MDR4325933.1 HAD family hydrolase [Bacillus pseudomycoides]MED1474335.1 HAD family hydrolase [Bacillus pseudomycoides]